MPININAIMTFVKLTTISNDRNLSSRRTNLRALQRKSGYTFNQILLNKF